MYCVHMYMYTAAKGDVGVLLVITCMMLQTIHVHSSTKWLLLWQWLGLGLLVEELILIFNNGLTLNYSIGCYIALLLYIYGI